MLKFFDNNKNKWFIEAASLRKYNVRSPQGFSFSLPDVDGVGNFFWTSDRFAAYLFYKRHKIAAPDVVEDFRETYEYEQDLFKLSYATEYEADFASPVGMVYRPYQVAGIEYGLRTANTLIADQQRLGKTIISIGIINNLAYCNKVLIVCPKTAKLVWQREIKLWLIEKKVVQVLDAQSEINPNADIYIINYDNLHVQSELTRIPFDLIIADEVHSIKNIKAGRTKFLFAIPGKKKLALSGTPLLNKPKDLLTVLKWLHPFWENFYIYKGEFATKSGITLSLDEVQDWIRSTLMLRRVQAQVFDGEPIDRRVVPLQTPKELKQYIDMEYEGFRKPWKLSDYTTSRRILGLSRVQSAINHILTYTTEGEKIVVFAWHKEVIDRIAASLGNRAVVIYGDTTDEQRAINGDRFNNDPTCNVIIGSITAMGMAINLSVSNHILFVEADYSDGMMEQAEERCSDKDQPKTVLVEMLAYEKSLDEHMFSIRYNKQDLAAQALDCIY